MNMLPPHVPEPARDAQFVTVTESYYADGRVRVVIGGETMLEYHLLDRPPFVLYDVSSWDWKVPSALEAEQPSPQENSQRQHP